MQRDRRRDPYPWTWEVPVGATALGLLVLVAGIQLGRSAANLLAGAGWTWPETGSGASGLASPIGVAFWTSLPGVLGGDAGAGLPPPASGGLAGAGLVWVSVAAIEVVLCAVTVWGGLWVYLRWGPGRMRGMATAAEAERLLGVTRLRRVAAVVRPDLHGRHQGLRGSVHRRAGTSDATQTEPASRRLGRGLPSPWLRR